MRNKILLILVLILCSIYGFIRSFKNKTSFFYLSENKVLVLNVDTNNIEEYDMEDYLIGVLAGEMPAAFEEEALKAQAVAARTYAYYKIEHSSGDYDLTTDKTTQTYLSISERQDKWGDDFEFYENKIKNAIAATKNEVLTYDNEVISAYYFSMSNGYTESSLAVFNEDKSYLTPVVSNEDAQNKNFKVTTTINKKDFCTKLNVDCSEIEITDIVKTESERIDTLSINNKQFTGIKLRKLLNLRSTDIEFNIDSDNILITTYGYGHGVGMSQYGANQMAKSGSTYQEILKHYYTGVEIAKIASIK